MPPTSEHVTALPGSTLAAGLAHPQYTVAAGTALVAALAGWAATAFPARKRLTWAVDLDMPVGLVPGQSPGMEWTVTVTEDDLRPADADPDNATAGWLVLVTVTNAGLTTVRGRDFAGPLAFRFPGREVCDTRICPDPAGLRSGRQPPAVPVTIDDPGPAAAGGSRAPGVVLGRELLLPRNGAFTLLALLHGKPARSLPPVSQEGSLTAGTIVAAYQDRSPFSSAAAACAAAAAVLAAILLGAGN